MAGGWASLGLLDELVQSVEEDFQWTLPTGIQDECIPLLLGGGDVMGSAETGSGKTAAFALPVLQLCVEYKEKDATESHDPGGAKKKDAHSNPDFLLSKQDRDPSISFDPQGKGLRIQSRDGSRWAGCRCSAGVSGTVPGKYSFECNIVDDGIVRIGWTGNADASLQLGTDMEGYGYGGTGMKVNNGNYEAFPSKKNKVAFGKGDIVSCHLQVFGDSKGGDEGKDAIVSYSKNGEFLGQAFEIMRSKNSKHSQRSFFPTVCVKNAECSLNFGSTKDLQFDLPPGFRPLATVQKGKGKSNIASKELVPNPRDELFVKLQLQKESLKKGPLAIVIEPTRDLAEQTYRAFCDLGKRLVNNPVQAALLVGGISPQATVKLLNQNLLDVLVGTPPIIASYMKKGTIKASRCRFFVLDEADELIDNDSLIHIRSIYGRLLASNSSKSRFDRLQVCFFSATLHAPKVRELAETLCHQPVWVDLRGQNSSIFPDTVHHCVVNLSPSKYSVKEGDFIESDAVHRKGKLSGKINLNGLDEKERGSELLKQMKPRVLLDLLERFKMEQVLIFCRTNLDCDLMEKFLRNAGGGGLADKYSCRVLAGMRSMEERQKALQDFKDGEARILVCTDVAARGIDIRELPFVINFTLPDRPEVYVHRIGRVGRAERMGLAISLVSTVKERVWFCRKGKKPPCEDTRDYEKGGNCIWYDEPKLMSDIEKLMKTNSVGVTKLQWPNMKIPPEISVLLETGAYGGEARSGDMNPEIKAKMGKIERDVVKVQVTESALQNDYWKLSRLPFR